MPIGYWIRLWFLAFNPLATYERACELVLKYGPEKKPEYDVRDLEQLAISGIRRTGEWRMDSLWVDVLRGLAYGYRTIQVDKAFTYPGLRTCRLTGNVYKVEAALILGFRVLYNEPQEAYPIGAGSFSGHCI